MEIYLKKKKTFIKCKYVLLSVSQILTDFSSESKFVELQSKSHLCLSKKLVHTDFTHELG